MVHGKDLPGAKMLCFYTVNGARGVVSEAAVEAKILQNAVRGVRNCCYWSSFPHVIGPFGVTNHMLLVRLSGPITCAMEALRRTLPCAEMLCFYNVSSRPGAVLATPWTQNRPRTFPKSGTRLFWKQFGSETCFDTNFDFIFL